MFRRFLLVGILVTVKQGSVEQIAYAALISMVYMALQISASPFRKPSDDSFASGCSVCLSVLYVVCIFYKFAALTDLDDVKNAMTTEQKQARRRLCPARPPGLAASPPNGLPSALPCRDRTICRRPSCSRSSPC